ncbi:MAG: cyclic nucleotide-binding domain-containing protein [Myxococcales bacterium]|nr:cyclic nucleotide-binding domain-containing protein [Myxococcales bacterium]MCB9530486.1 cyclic nucleotide-binding domain-containing protein [Myxococcales bacterium]MCB9533438.1 cyclic nucleotide-binding domain-containing protein [Myxococcales bacterium]
MDIGKLSERTRLQRRIEDEPGDVDARKALARLMLDAGDPRRAAGELMSIVRLLLATGDVVQALAACRAALHLDPDNLELRLLLAQVHARFPDPVAARVAEPIDVVDLSPTQRLEEVDILEEIEAPENLDERDAVTRPPLPTAARQRSDSEAPITVEVGRPSPAFETGDVPRRAGAGDGWPAPDAVATHAHLAADVPTGTLRTELAPSDWSDRDTSPNGNPAVAEHGNTHTFERRRSAAARASSRGADARLPQGSAQLVAPAAVRDNAVMSRVGDALARELLSAGQIVGYPDTAPIVVAGKPVESLIFLLDGGARVHDGGPAPAAPAYQSPGQLIGEFEILGGALPRATVTAAGPTRTVEVPAAAVASLRDRDPDFRDVLGAALRDTVIDDLMARATLFASIGPEQRREIATRFFSLDVESGEIVVQRGQINRRLLVVLDGQLVVDGRGGNRVFGRMNLGPGDFFGYVATVLGRPAQVTVVAASRASILVLPEQEVYRLVAAHKGVARAARREAVERGEIPVSVMTVAGIGGPLLRVPT